MVGWPKEPPRDGWYQSIAISCKTIGCWVSLRSVCEPQCASFAGGDLSGKMITSRSSLPNPVLEGMETRAGQRGKSASLDLIFALNARLSRVEVTVGGMRDCLDVQEEHFDEFNSQDEELKGEVQEIVRKTLEIVIERYAQLESMLDILRHELEELRAELVAVASEEEQQPIEVVKLGSMLLRVVNKAGNRAKGLMFANLIVARQKVKALVDMGASDLFVFEQGVAKLSIKVDSAGGWVKTVNFKRVHTKGIAKGIDVQLGQWHGVEDIEVISMDD
ncbi:Uncharacterized protein TCM_033736 [Theobroma cacao]|uniref:Uncharacterized protein n=1 Tax=Theobroma cacao TaxID=3641 RepID=A0A061FBD3_THECC|nr:Uncharacterized protein TCM_033736 [Theobroma cacao]